MQTVLARALEAEGWQVELSDRAAGLWSLLDQGVWDAVFVDVSLPDARGREHLEMLMARARSAQRSFKVIALVRDTLEETWVHDAGIASLLRKPFAPGTVEGLVRGLRPTTPA